jgi:hypothetical protein
VNQWEKGRGEGDQSHVSEDLVRVCRYVLVAFVVAFDVDKTAFKGGGNRSWRLEPRRYAFVVRISRVRRYVLDWVQSSCRIGAARKEEGRIDRNYAFVVRSSRVRRYVAGFY